MSYILVMMVWPKSKWGDHARTEEGHCDLLKSFKANVNHLFLNCLLISRSPGTADEYLDW